MLLLGYQYRSPIAARSNQHWTDTLVTIALINPEMSLPTGHKIVPQTPTQEELEKNFKGHPSCRSIRIEPGNWYLPSAFEKYAEDIANFAFEDNETIVMTAPKSGTTWTQEIVWTMKNNSNFDHPMAQLPLNLRSPIVEADSIIDHVKAHFSFNDLFDLEYPDFDQSHGMLMHLARMSPRPRVIKTHISFPLLSPTVLEKAKVVYVIRDPRDACISYHHHSVIFTYDKFEGTFDEYVDAFIEGAVWLGPYWPHVTEAWKRRDHPNLHIIFYEKLLKNTKEELKRLDKFLETNIPEEKFDKIIEYTSFAEMKKRDNHVIRDSDAPHVMNLDLVKTEGGFFWKGKSGRWREILTEEQKEKFEAWIKKNCPDQEIMNSIINP